MRIGLALAVALLVGADPGEAAAKPKQGFEIQIAPDYETWRKPPAMVAAWDLIKAGKAAQALKEQLEPALADFANKYTDPSAGYFCARSGSEAIIYGAGAALNGARKAVVLNPTWAETLYAKGYALVELGLPQAALDTLAAALQKSPQNAKYLSEIGNIHQTARDWPKALERYEAALSATELASPDASKVPDRTRALRGKAFVFVELGRIDEAEKLYFECLKLDPDDRMAKNELTYIAELRAKSGKTVPTT